MLPTQRTLAYFRERGCHAAVVERWIAPAKRRLDVHHWGDILVHSKRWIALIQTTTTSNMSAREAKLRELLMKDSPLADWLYVGRLLLIGWGKYSKPCLLDGKLTRWQPRLKEVNLLHEVQEISEL